MRREHTQRGEAMHKLVLLIDGSYEIPIFDDKTVTVKIGCNIERVLRDRLTTSPATTTVTPYVFDGAPNNTAATKPSRCGF